MKRIIPILLVAVLFLPGCSGNSDVETTVTEESTSTTETTVTEIAVTSTAIETTEPPTIATSDEVTTVAESTTESDPKDVIASDVRYSVYGSTTKVDVSINKISINENLGTDSADDYIALIHLSFNTENSASTSKKMLNLINNEIAYNLADIDSINELTIFWTVPYLSSSDNNIAKANFLRNDSGFYFEEEWYDASIF